MLGALKQIQFIQSLNSPKQNLLINVNNVVALNIFKNIQLSEMGSPILGSRNF